MLGIATLLILGIAFAFLVLSRNRAIALAGGSLASLHSRPSYHGLYSFLWASLVGVGVLIILSVLGGMFLQSSLMAEITRQTPDALVIERQLILSDAAALWSGGIPSRVDPLREMIAERYGTLETLRLWGSALLGLGAALATGYITYRQVSTSWRARNRSERIIRNILLVAAVIAVLTTIGIVLSLIFETLNFFGNIGWRIDKFLFGTRWSPLSGVHSGEMDPDKVGAIPLFVGTFLSP
ncbi:MAG: phosphate ABC transporter permease family protein [Pseudomonadota bacterium]